MKIIKSRHLTLTNNNPKICVPLTGKNFSEIAAQAKAVAGMHPDLAEWRADFLEEIIKEPSAGSFLRLAKPILEELKKILPDTPLIFTLRTKEEGGMVSFSEDAYREICIAAAKTAGDYPIDFIDVEAVRIADAKSFIKEIHDAGCLVIGSNHHFSKTPPQSGHCKTRRDAFRKRRRHSADGGVKRSGCLPKDSVDYDVHVGIRSHYKSLYQTDRISDHLCVRYRSFGTRSGKH